MHRPCIAGMYRGLDDRFDWRKAGAACKQDDGSLRGAQIELSEWHLDPQGIADCQPRQDPRRKRSARYMPDVEFGAVVVARSVRHGEVAPVAAVHHDLQVLARLERRPQPDRKT